MSSFRLIPFSLAFLSLILASTGVICDYDPLVADLLDEGSQDRWVDWIAALSGAEPIPTETGEAVISTRSSFVMFEPDQTPSAFQYLQEELTALGFTEGEDYTIHTYAYPYDDRYPERNWKNLILTFPGDDPSLEDERVLLVAHLDSTSGQELELAPGADDNGSGAAGLLEAAARLRHYSFDRTIHLVWFSGEEQSRYGSEYFVSDYEDWLPDIVAVINLDMFAFDWDNDRCFEVHAGTLSGSQEIGEYMAAVIDLYELDLTFDFIDDDTAYTYSDHNPFWEAGVPAIMVFENFFYQEGETCGNVDRNTQYHTVADTLTYINEDTGYDILQASIATLAHIAGPIESCFTTTFQAEIRLDHDGIDLHWTSIDGASVYQVWINTGQRWEQLGETTSTRWTHILTESDRTAIYKVVAVSDSGCQSDPVILFPNILDDLSIR